VVSCAPNPYIVIFETGAGADAIGAYIGGPIGDTVDLSPLMGIFGLLFIISTLALFGIKEKTMAVGMKVFEGE